MQETFDFDTLGENIVYVKQIPATDLPDEVQDQIGELKTLFAVHNQNGEQLALVATKKLAFHLAEQNQLQPVTLQ